MARQPPIRASEVGRYAYCARAWWLQYVRGYAPENREALERGDEDHAAHGRHMRSAAALTRAARWAAAVALALAALVATSILRG
jgi:hypothetical protein